MMTRILTRGYLWLLLALLYSPILIIMIFSFTEAKVLGNWTGFSTKLYSSLFTGGMHHSLINAIWNTFAIALLAATASTALGSIAAIGIFNLRSRTRQVMNFANAIPMMNADIITGVSLFLLFVSFGISQGFTTVVLAHITFCTPYVVLSVLDRGPGIAPAEMGEIFNPFIRGDRARGGKGTGLGLAIVKRIAALHGGSVELRNRSGGGLEARICLPLGLLLPRDAN